MGLSGRESEGTSAKKCGGGRVAGGGQVKDALQQVENMKATVSQINMNSCLSGAELLSTNDFRTQRTQKDVATQSHQILHQGPADGTMTGRVKTGCPPAGLEGDHVCLTSSGSHR